MKKIFLSVALLLALMLNTKSYASELILYSQDGFDIKTDSFIQDAAGYISLVKNSNLNITFTNDKDYSLEKDEPSVDLKVYKKDTKDVVFTVKTPTKRVLETASEEEIQKSNEVNKVYLDNFKLYGKNVEIKVPLNFQGGMYDMDLMLNNNGKKINLRYSFSVSDSSYRFTTSNILIEDTSVIAKIGYVSLLGVEQENKVVVTLVKDNKEIFRKEIDKKFYPDEGSILVDENIPEMSSIKGNVDLKIEIKDKNGNIILSQSKSVSILKSKGKMMYYILTITVLLFVIVLFLFFKKRKSKLYILIFGFIFISLSSFLTVGIKAASPCGTKPADVCVENNIITNFCQKNDTCATTDARVKKFFSTGKVLNLASASSDPYTNNARAEPVSVVVNICSNIAQTLSSGDNFYVISETSPDQNKWSRKRYHTFNFKKGYPSTLTFDPSPSSSVKRLVDKAIYKGGCEVTVSVEYQGGETDSGEHQTTIIETGKMTSTMCKSRTVNLDIFDFKSSFSLSDTPTCINSENTGLRNTFIDGSVIMDPIVNNTAGIKKKVNVCSYLGIKQVDLPALKSTKKRFYAILEQTSSWTMIHYPIFSFTFGDVNGGVDEYNAGGPNQIKNLYNYGLDKEFIPDISYDGECEINFALRPHGWNDTDQHTLGLRLIELGKVSDASCRDASLTTGDKYRLATVETLSKQSKLKNGKYANIASFFYGISGDGSGGLPKCSAVTSCSSDYNWIKSATNTSCPPPATTTPVLATTTPQTSCSCNGGRSYQCTGSATSTTPNAVDCALGSTCVVATTTTTTTFTVSPKNAIGNIIYTNTPDSASPKTLSKTSSYTYSIPKTDSNQSISVTLKDIDDATVSQICSIDNGTTTTPPTTTPVIGECSTVDKNVCLRDTTLATNPIPYSDSSKYYWTCDGTGGGGSKSCSLDKTTTPPPPIINLTKDPKVTLNRGGKCTLSWEIQNIPEGGTCVLTGWGINASGQNVTNTSSSTTIFDLRTNQKYVLTCSNLGQPITTISKSVICRINPNIIEN